MKMSDCRIISLSHPISPVIPLWPNDPPVTLSSIADRKKDGYYLRMFSMGEHSATHINAPASFFESSSSAWMQPKYLPIVVIDVVDRAWRCSDFVFQLADLHQLESRQGNIPANSLVVFRTGWFRLWHDRTRFFGLDTNGGMHFPSLSAKAVEYLIRKRNVAGIGTDTHGIDAPWDSEYTNNRFILSHNAIVLECLAALDKLPVRGASAVIAPLALVGGSGAPTTVTAFCPVSSVD